MKNLIITASVVLLTAFGLAPRMKADAWDQLTKVTFSEPVEIPGQVLAAGTYWFRLMDSPSDRDIVQILNADQSRSIAIILAIPDYRLKPTGKTVITFEERAANAPQAVKAWFYPGDNYGQEFVYPKPRAMQLAKAENQPVPSMPANMEANTKVATKSAAAPSVVAMKQSSVKAEQPSGQEVEVVQVFTPPPQVAKNTAPAETPATLPATASSMPLVGLVGLLLISLGIPLLVRKTN